MNSTVFLTVLSGALTYVVGQVLLKLYIEPALDLRKTVGLIAHAMVHRANVIQNPGVPTSETMTQTSNELRTFSAQLQAHIYLIPRYGMLALLFGLPSKANVLSASKSLLGLSNSIYTANESVYDANSKRVENVCDSLGIYLSPDDRWRKEEK